MSGGGGGGGQVVEPLKAFKCLSGFVIYNLGCWNEIAVRVTEYRIWALEAGLASGRSPPPCRPT